MEITEVRVKLMNFGSNKLQAFCSITIADAFVIRDLKIIKGTKGLFVAMPSRKMTDRCSKCGGKNHLSSYFCNECGARLSADRAPRDDLGRAKLHADIAHPINSVCREEIHRVVCKAFEEEVEKSKLPGYIPPSDIYDDDYIGEFEDGDDNSQSSGWSRDETDDARVSNRDDKSRSPSRGPRRRRGRRGQGGERSESSDRGDRENDAFRRDGEERGGSRE